MNQQEIEGLGAQLHQARLSASAIAPLSGSIPGMTLQDAYRIQQDLLRRRLQQGERLIGHKIGVTSQVVMDMLKVGQPDFGHLTSAMVYNDGAVPIDSLIAPKAEGEIAFILKHDLAGPGVTEADVLRATQCVLPCFEVVDSRIRDWQITIQDTVADNASSGCFVLGDGAADPRAVDLATVGMTLEKNGAVVATGAGAAALGHPLAAVAWLANTLGALGKTLHAGEVILSGSLAAMVPVARGDRLRMSLGGIGSAEVHFY
ncbi:fumarylacetoacetate hydrolase family protein [Janthinobacterium agaricidamnosum]|uniref:2-hydroxypent-2,4-dienoate hydratase n=1 Tax=Janthinobacterium agaricidamnosum NBRC 102515 = DSM 9628 TaxID=1349767 RepID=W0UWS4_9BURK|nr:fumarylacetoacetate hydrolase family protein [Janthinobacterium agaricidamnosum]CDG80899.1 2-hydroxypent-2,4-dienoate hydratase [Janthinobacterium agaricidamnosum NBRC 102515 = DSM 9628]